MTPEQRTTFEQRCDEMAAELNAPPIEGLDLGSATQLDPGQVANSFEELCDHLASNLNRDAELVASGAMTPQQFDAKW